MGAGIRQRALLIGSEPLHRLMQMKGKCVGQLVAQRGGLCGGPQQDDPPVALFFIPLYQPLLYQRVHRTGELLAADL
ncbi:hypothetical protein SDC9_211122 [bioreactor metagenome]|uniref:Uncharacterized protein n=1 Tax=bioreactor metagenome TaxID=1076179 RepID=A0A645JTV0_9ZZZZ